MGEVYVAYDPRLKRRVALKVLRESQGLASEQVQQLTREARAAGSLNHPNIVAVFDVGIASGVPYVVTELLEGESLRQRLGRGRLPYRKALELGRQIALALADAHEKGIWHRDVKPGNVFITTDARAKLLDFGLAKRKPAAAADPEDSTASASDAGAIRGTAGYMSPEQVRGDAVDHRTDIFGLGAVLYEMFTGARAFRPAAGADLHAAVLGAEPVDPRELVSDLPAAAVAAVRRCLEKAPAERFQSARDLAFHLQQLLDAETMGVRSPTSARRRGPLVAAATMGLALLALALAFSHARSPGGVTFEPVTFRRGRIGGARFASGGEMVVYSAAHPSPDASRRGNTLDVFRIDLSGTPQSKSLGHAGADVLAARHESVALSFDRRFVGGRRFVGTLAVGPLSGSTQARRLIESVEEADFDPEGANLAIAHRLGDGRAALEYGGERRVLHATSGCIRHPRVSPDGRRVAFVEDASGLGFGGRVGVSDLEGRVAWLTETWRKLRGLAWSPDGGELWFAAEGGDGERALRAVTLSGKQRIILAAPGALTLWDVAGDGRVLLSRDEEWSGLVGKSPDHDGERDLSWLDGTGLADLSEDGRTILFGDRFGIYTRPTDGGPPISLDVRDVFADDLSPDGRTALVTNAAMTQLRLVPTAAGAPRDLPAHGMVGYRGAMWLPNGRQILFNAIDPEAGESAPSGEGAALRSYIQDVASEPPTAPRALTPRGTWVLAVSPDGRWGAAVEEPRKGLSLWPLEGGGAPRHLLGSHPEDRPAGFSGDGRSLWVYHRGEVPAVVFKVDLLNGGRTVWRTLVPPDPNGVYSIMKVKVTPGGDAYVYGYAGALSQLYVVRGLR